MIETKNIVLSNWLDFLCYFFHPRSFFSRFGLFIAFVNKKDSVGLKIGREFEFVQREDVDVV
jgi:hypothetical protein